VRLPLVTVERRVSRRRAIGETTLGIVAILAVIAVGAVFARGLEAMGVGSDWSWMGGVGLILVVLGVAFYFAGPPASD
jgi:hypothetical protein